MAAPIQSSFAGGEVSPEFYGRLDSERYAQSLAKCLNYCVTRRGSLVRRPGTRFVASVKDPTRFTRLERFRFNLSDSYVLELGHLYLRLYRENGQVLAERTITGATQANPCVITSTNHEFKNGQTITIAGVVGMTQLNGNTYTVANAAANTFELSGVNSTGYTAYVSGGTATGIYEVTMPYQEADLADVQIVQSADVVYLAHPSYAPRKLTRTAHTRWTLTTIDFLDGPYLPTNTGAITLTASATTGAITLTASAALWNVSTDTGRLVRLLVSGTWGWVQLTGFSSTTVASATVRGTLGGTTATASWRLGIWSATTGYPATVEIHEDRLLWGGAAAAAYQAHASNVGDYENYAPTNASGTVLDTNGVTAALAGGGVDPVLWAKSDQKGVLFGTEEKPYLLRPNSQNAAITPNDLSAKPIGSQGSAARRPVRADASILFLDTTTKQLFELGYFLDRDGFEPENLSILSEHLTKQGVSEIVFQQKPHGILWCVCADGTLAALTFFRGVDSFFAAWHQHRLGGVVNAGGDPARVESATCVRSTDGSSDEMWFVVKRFVNGATVRYVEYMAPFRNDWDAKHESYFVDCGLTREASFDITAVTQDNPVKITTSAAHGFSVGETVFTAKIDASLVPQNPDDPTEVLGMRALNDRAWKVRATPTSTTFTIETEDGDAVDGAAAGYAPYASGGVVSKRVSTVSGLSHLEGQTVAVLGDGSAQTAAVASGSIALSSDAAFVAAGLPFNADGQLLRVQAGSRDGVALGKEQQLNKVTWLLHQTLGLKYGLKFGTGMEEVNFTTDAPPAGGTARLFTGLWCEHPTFEVTKDAMLCWRQDQPYPGTILAVLPQLETYDES